MDFGGVVSLTICIIWSFVNAQRIDFDDGDTGWQFGTDPWSGRLRMRPDRRLETDLHYHYDDRLTFSGRGWVDTSGRAGARIGLEWTFKKRATEMTTDVFYLSIETSPCQFIVYDRNMDGVVTYEEIRSVFPDVNLASRLFLDLDTTSGDRVITREEFDFMAPKLINGCGPIVPLPIFPEDQPNPTQSSESDDRSNLRGNATFNEGKK